MRRIYLASSWRNQYQPMAVQLLRQAGHEVYDFRNPNKLDKGFGWSEIDGHWTSWDTKEYIEALKHPAAERGYSLDYTAMVWADTFVLLLPCGKSAHLEAGWAAGAQKEVFAYVPEHENTEPELMYKMFTGITGSSQQLLGMLKGDK